jgi:hypothetical protein
MKHPLTMYTDPEVPGALTVLDADGVYVGAITPSGSNWLTRHRVESGLTQAPIGPFQTVRR